MEYKELFKEYKRIIRNFDGGDDYKHWQDEVRSLAHNNVDRDSLIEYFGFLIRRSTAPLRSTQSGMLIVLIAVVCANILTTRTTPLVFDVIAVAAVIAGGVIANKVAMNKELKRMFYEDCIKTLKEGLAHEDQDNSITG
mgnify:CR=1 FL=1